MDIQILDINELENGGAELIINMDDEAKKHLLNFAIMELIKRGLVEVTEMWEGHNDKQSDSATE